MGTVNVTLGDGKKLNLILGQQLENAVTAVIFDFSAWQTEFGSGTLGLSVQRHGDTQPYAVVPTVSGTNATWNISELDTAYKGVGEVQVTYTVGSVVKKSTVYKFTVYRSLGENGEYPSPGQTWQEEIEDELADVKADFNNLLEGYIDVLHPTTQGKLIAEFANLDAGWVAATNIVTKKQLSQYEKGTVLTVVNADANFKIGILAFQSSNGVYTRKINQYINGDYTVTTDGYYWTFYVERNGGGAISPSEISNIYVCVKYSPKTQPLDLYICGNDSATSIKDVIRRYSFFGKGYCVDDNETNEEGINTFIDSYINTPCNIHFYGTITTSTGIHKHPLHNLFGYGCTLKMGANLDQSYHMCIKPTNGEVSYDPSNPHTYVITHNHTYVKGFVLDGNCENNKSGSAYPHNELYGAVICGEIYNNPTSPFRGTQLCSDIVLEDIIAKNTMRGIIPCIGWICRNLIIGDAVLDHAIYLAGADGAVVDNCEISGYHKNGAISISSSTWDATRQVGNIYLHNVRMIECEAGLIDVRGLFSTSNGNGFPTINIKIDGLYVKNVKNMPPFPAIMLGTQYSQMPIDIKNAEDFPINIVFENSLFEVACANSLFFIANANTTFRNVIVRLYSINTARALFRLESNQNIDRLLKISDSAVVCVTNDVEMSKDYIWANQYSSSRIWTEFLYVGDVNRITVDTVSSNTGYQFIGVNIADDGTVTTVYTSPIRTGSNSYYPRTGGYSYCFVMAFYVSNLSPTDVPMSIDDGADNVSITFRYGFIDLPTGGSIFNILNSNSNCRSLSGISLSDLSISGFTNSYLIGLEDASLATSVKNLSLERVNADGISVFDANSRTSITLSEDYLTVT